MRLDAAAAVAVAEMPAVKLLFELLPFATACVWFWVKVRRMVSPPELLNFHQLG